MKRIAIALSLMLSGCATTRESYPARTATEQMLISEAAEDAARQLSISVPAGRKCFLDITNFEGVDARYAVSAIRQHLMENGMALVDSKDVADTIIEIRAGALSIDSNGKVITMPGLQLDRLMPIPLGFASPLSFNQWSRKLDQGVAKFSAFAYDKASGKLIVVAKPVVGQSKRARINGQTVFVKSTP